MKDPSEFDTTEFFLPISRFGERPQLYSSLVRVDFGAISDVGKVRENNEDAFLIFGTGRYWQKILTNMKQDLLPERHEENAYVMAVADGMGGMAAGEVASTMALTTVVNLMLSSVKWALKLDHPELRDEEIQEGVQRAIEYLSKADFAIGRRAEEEPAYQGMGTTLTACYSFGDDLFIFHVGDSRAYLFRQGKFQQLTHDHTIAQALADLGDISQEEIATHHYKHVLTRAVGRHEGKLDVEIHHLKLVDNDQVLLCTDGLTDLVANQQIAEALNRESSSQMKCETLIKLALQAGGKDNVTAVLGHYHLPEKGKD